MVKWAILILLLLLAFGKQLMGYLGLDCSCENPGGGTEQDPHTDQGGQIALPGDGIVTQQKQIDVELYQRSQDQDVTLMTEQSLAKEFFPGTQTLELTQTSYVKNVI